MNSNTSATMAPSQNLTAAELEQGRLYLQQTEDGITGATKGLATAQWNFKPAADRWSIAEILEHVVFVQERVLGMLREQLANSPAAPAEERDTVDSVVLGQFGNRLKKFKAPDFAYPSGRWTPEEALGRLALNCAGLKSILEVSADLRGHSLESPPLKAVTDGAYRVMDGYQWLLTAAAHTERHTKQILEVKAHANFPA